VIAFAEIPAAVIIRNFFDGDMFSVLRACDAVIILFFSEKLIVRDLV
jgi:hypothetical protein